MAAVGRELQGVDEQVGHDLAELAAVAVHGHRGQRGVDRQTLGGQLRPEGLDLGGGHGGEVHGGAIEALDRGACAAEGVDLRDERVEAYAQRDRRAPRRR